MKEIKLTQGKVALVDDEDFEYLNKFTWQADRRGNKTDVYYARRTFVGANGVKKTFYMHREIMKLTDSKIVCDHKDHDGLNNQKYNIRVCTRRENAMNKRAKPNKKYSQYLGVSYFKNSNRKKKWLANMTIDYKTVFIGYFETEREAAQAYNIRAKEVNGQYANLNVL